VGLFDFFKKSTPATPEVPAEQADSGPVRKDRPTPTRREAEAARMARLHPELDPKKAKQLNREASAQQRRTQLTAVDHLPERQLMRDVVDSRFNVGEFALPAMLLILLVAFIPALQGWAEVSLYLMWAVIALIAGDLVLMWRKYRRLAEQRIPDRPRRGILFYGWNRQMSFRRWRTPAPRVERGQAL
jgi:hypothetical protein